MWSSRIMCLVGRAPSAQFVPLTPPSRLCRRTYVVAPTTTLIDRRNIESLPFHETQRCMSKYLSKSAAKRLPLNTKRAKKGYYKGKGSTSEGRITSKGTFIADPMKKLQLIIPDLEGFPLKSYIARAVPKIPPEKRPSPRTR